MRTYPSLPIKDDTQHRKEGNTDSVLTTGGFRLSGYLIDDNFGSQNSV